MIEIPATDLRAKNLQAPAPVPRLQIDLSIDHDQLDRVIGLLTDILTRVKRLEAQGVRSMATLADIGGQLADLQVDVESETEVTTSVETLLDGQTALLVAIQAQLEAALAANDPAALQAVSDAIAQINTTNAANKARTVAAVVKNTPAAAKA